MTYVTQQDIELSWEYRNDGIVELTYNVTTDPSNPLKLVARTKVPDSPKGYYDTILHGEYVKMHFTEIVTLQTRTLESVNYNGFNSGAKTVYLENEMFDLGSLNEAGSQSRGGYAVRRRSEYRHGERARLGAAEHDAAFR